MKSTATPQNSRAQQTFNGGLTPFERNVQNFIEKHRTWTDVDTRDEIRDKIQSVRVRNPGLAERFRRMADNGKTIVKLQSDAKDAGRNRDDVEFASITEKLRSLEATEWEMNKARSQFEEGCRRGPAPQYNPERPVRPGLPNPDYDRMGPIPFNIRNLAASSEWTIMVDETGDLFDKEGVIHAGHSQRSGKVVSLLIPEGCDLPRLRGGEHAAEEAGFRATERRLGDVFSASPRCGILGVTLEGMPFVQASEVNYWYAAVERSFDLILRLLPFPEQGRVKIRFLVEAHGVDKTGLGGQRRMVKRALDTSLYRLAKSDPDLDGRIQAVVEV